MKGYDNCRKCGELLPNSKLFSALHDDPDYVICELCILKEDCCCVGVEWEDFRKL